MLHLTIQHPDSIHITTLTENEEILDDIYRSLFKLYKSIHIHILQKFITVYQKKELFKHLIQINKSIENMPNISIDLQQSSLYNNIKILLSTINDNLTTIPLKVCIIPDIEFHWDDEIEDEYII